jgi:hypothetical protein
MPRIGRPILCECAVKVAGCKTCKNRRRRVSVDAKRELRRAQDSAAARSKGQRLKADPVAYAAYREKRNAKKRALYKPVRRFTEAQTLTVTDLGEDRLYTIEEWLETFGPIGSHGNYFHPLIA